MRTDSGKAVYSTHKPFRVQMSYRPFQFETQPPAIDGRSNDGRTDNEELPRLLLIAFCCDPDFTMEDRNGWHRAIHAAQSFHVTVLVAPHACTSRLYESVPEELKDRIEFIAVELSPREQHWVRSELLFYVGYRAWMKKGMQIANTLHRTRPFAITHLVSLCGYREPGEFWKLDCPFILGPIGGTSSFPVKFLGVAGITGGLFELARNVLNYYQLKISKRIRNAIRRSTVVIAANSSTQRDFSRTMGIGTIPVELETGLDYEPDFAKPPRNVNQPFRILWTGRLRAWKGLPLLLRAIAQLPPEVEVELRVIGDGKCKQSWKKLAESLRITDRVQWIERPHYRDSLEHYRWADAFAFTSLRDTSGSGLLEALAAGTPIIGMDHQGASDIMTTDCAIKVSVESPRKSIDDFRNGIIRLSQDSTELARLSEGALHRAEHYLWAERHEAMSRIYRSLVSTGSSLIGTPQL